MHEPGNKFATPADTLAEFIGQYVAGVAASMKRIVELIGDNGDPHDCSSSFYYFHFLSQVRTYYPGIRQKIERVFSHDHDLWAKVVQKAKESGEIRSDTDVKKTATMFRQMFLGLSYEQAFLNGLNVDELAEKTFAISIRCLKPDTVLFLTSIILNVCSKCGILFYLWSMKQNSATWIRFRNKEEASCCTKKQGTVQTTYG